MLVRRALIVALLLAGCSAADFDDADASLDTEEGRGDTDTTDEDSDEPEVQGPTYWAVDGELEVLDGAPLAEGSEVTVTFLGADARPWSTDGASPSTCRLSVLQAVEGPPDETDDEAMLLGWWQLSLEQDPEAPCPWSLPTPQAVGETELSQLVVGFGALDTRLAPALDAAGLDSDLPVYGLYALHPSPDGDVTYIIGTAGTAGQYDGIDERAMEPPVMDGRYLFQTLLLMPIPGAGSG